MHQCFRSGGAIEVRRGDKAVSKKGTGRQAGSAVLFALFVCLAVAIWIQALTVAVLCGYRALNDEVAGRSRLAAQDRSLEHLLDRALGAWGFVDWEPCDDNASALFGRLVPFDEGHEWVLRAEVRESATLAGDTTCALVERGRDGMDLPQAALVATTVSAASARVTPWLSVEALGAEASPPASDVAVHPAVAYVEQIAGPCLVDIGCRTERLSGSWGLDSGWLQLLAERGSWGPRVVALSGDEGEILSLPSGEGVSSAEEPLLVVVTGGADLDLRDRSDEWLVVVVDGASLQLEGTTVHGAVFVGERVDFGDSGRVVYDPRIWEWATDRSLVRARLVPGSRQEDTE